jgi:hypothetical protein
VVPLRRATAVWKMRAHARVGDALVAEAEFLVGIRPRTDAASAPAAK